MLQPTVLQPTKSQPAPHGRPRRVRRLRRLVALGTLALAPFAAMPNAQAAPPMRTPSEPVHTVLPAFLTGCGDLLMSGPAGSRTTIHFDQDGNMTAYQLNGVVKVTLTSLVTDKSIDLNISGVVRIADGMAALSGPNLLYAPGLPLLYATGRTVVDISNPPGPGNVPPLYGHVTELCPLLS